MLVEPRGNAGTQLVIDRVTYSIKLQREFAASPERVFQAWTRPEQVKCWWDPAGEPLEACEIDLRPGGSFKFVMKHRPEMPFTGTYREIVPGQRLVFDALGALGRVLLEQVAGKTHMLVEIECRSEQHLDEYLKMGVDVGTSQTLNNLVAYMSTEVTRGESGARKPGIGPK
jgi:uncharacterized protein YndB with AHSA1/START domain